MRLYLDDDDDDDVDNACICLYLCMQMSVYVLRRKRKERTRRYSNNPECGKQTVSYHYPCIQMNLKAANSRSPTIIPADGSAAGRGTGDGNPYVWSEGRIGERNQQLNKRPSRELCIKPKAQE